MNTKASTVTLIAACLLLSSLGRAATAETGDWQLAMLHEPSPAQLNIEKRGRVFIYDRLNDVDVELAMNSQFDRIERMMFVRTQRTTQDGEVETADDDCD